MITLLPLEGHGPDGFELFPALGGLALLIMVVAAVYLLWRQGLIRLPSVARPETPEATAKRILSERFAHGDLSSEEFLDRASMLNWTPGLDPAPAKRRPITR